MSDGLKVLQLVSYHLYTGAAEPVLRLSRALIENGHTCRVAFDSYRPGDMPERAGRFGVCVARGPLLSVKAPPWKIPADIAWLRRALREYDVVHCHRSHDHVLTAAASLLEGKGRRAVVIRTFHGSGPLRRTRKWLYRLTDGFVSTCRRDERRIMDLGLCEKDRVVRVEGALDFERWEEARDGLRPELGLGAEVPVAGMVARMKKGRGHELVISAWRHVSRQLPGATLLLVGRGELQSVLERKVASLGISRSVVFCGYRQDLQNVYPAFDLKVMLAPGNDGTCRAALEAMACGVPVAAARKGALEDIVEHGVTGWLVRDESPEALGEDLVRLLQDRRMVRATGRKAREVARQRFTTERQLELVLGLYERCLSRGAGS